MKKIVVLLGSLMLFASAASAQNLLGGILKSVAGEQAGEAIGNVLSSVVGSTVDLAGNWTYGGVGAAVKSDNILSTVAGNAAISTIETKADNILAKAGISAGAATFTFNQDGTFSFKAGRLPALSGTYVQGRHRERHDRRLQGPLQRREIHELRPEADRVRQEDLHQPGCRHRRQPPVHRQERGRWFQARPIGFSASATKH